MLDLIINLLRFKKVKEQLPEVAPPWILFPDCKIPTCKRADMHQEWFEIVWTPYWDSLDYIDQSAYLDKWDCPDDWREYLHPTFMQND